MANTQVYNGYIYEQQADGSWKRTTPAQPQMPADPTYPYQGAQAQAQAQQAANKAAASEYDPQRAALDARIQQLEIAAAERELAAQQTEQADTAEMQATKGLRSRLRTGNILEAIKNARTLARKGGTGYESLMAALPMSDARALESALSPIKANLAFERLQEMRDESKTGGALGSVSERELDLLSSAVSSLDTGVSQEQFLSSLDAIERHFVGSQMALTGIDPTSEEGSAVYREYGVAPIGEGSDTPDGPKKLGIAEQFATDTDKRFAAAAQSAFDKGATYDELQAMAQQYGYGEWNPDQLRTAIQFRNQGGEGATLTAPKSGYNDPSIYDRAVQNIGESALGGYIGGAGNALTFGAMDELVGISQGDSIADAFGGTGRFTNEANLKKDLLADASPDANAIGNVAGGVLGALGTGAVAGAGRAATALAPRALLGDAAFGAAYGAGENNDSRLAGAGLGAVAGAGGGAIGRGIVNGIGNAVGGVGGPAQYLREQGIRMTPGQIGESAGGLGRMLKRREDRLAGFSGIGDAIGAQQNKGIDQFNQAAFRQGLSPVSREVPPSIAEEGVEAAEGIVSDAYGRALDGQNFGVDQQFKQALRGRFGQASQLPAMGDQAAYALNKSTAPFVDPAKNITGRNMQKMTQEMQRRASLLDKVADADGPDAAAILRGAYDDVGDMVDRQAPGVMQDFRNANTAYGNVQTLKDAVARAVNTEGRFTPAQLGMAARASGKKYGGKHASTDRQFFDLQRAGQQVLPSKIPDSGTAGREAAGDGITGIVKSSLRNLRLPLYSDPALEALNAIALARPQAARQAGEQIRRQARIGGLFGAPMMVNYAN